MSEYSKYVTLTDYGPEPFVANVAEATVLNTNFRTAFWTGKHLQMTLMEIKVGESIGLEMHSTLDQYLMIATGDGFVTMGKTEQNLNYQKTVRSGFGIFVPAGTYHNLINTGATPLKLFSIYAPPNHPHGTVHKTKADAEKAEYH